MGYGHGHGHGHGHEVFSWCVTDRVTLARVLHGASEPRSFLLLCLLQWCQLASLAAKLQPLAATASRCLVPQSHHRISLSEC